MLPTYPQSSLAVTDARIVSAAWIALVVTTTCWLAHRLFGLPMVLAHIGFAVFLVLGLAHVVLALSHRCPRCNKHPFIQGFERPHAAAASQSRIPGWAGAADNVLKRRQLVCIHCGAGFHIDA